MPFPPEWLYTASPLDIIEDQRATGDSGTPRTKIGETDRMDRLVINAVVALGTGLSLVLIVGLVELQPVGASTEGYETVQSTTIGKVANT